MCGIVGYIGKKKALPILISGLKSLEYRGYDSSGVAFIKDNKINVIKKEGKIVNLEENLNLDEECYLGIGHTRWATHGVPNETNAHPHTVGDITIVHNGIIENYETLKKELIKENYEFISETDTEVACATIDSIYKKEKDKLKTLNKLFEKLEGSYALGIIFHDDVETLYAVRKDSPLIVGTNVEGNFIASDVPAILEHTKEYFLLEKDEIAVIKENKIVFYNNNKKIKKDLNIFEGDSNAAMKNGYDHFMLKEIHEEPITIKNTVEHFKNNNTIEIEKYKKIEIIACGSAYHAGLVSKYLFEKYAKIKVELKIASEYRYDEFLTEKDTLVIAISQSGETADTLAAIKIANENKIDTLGIVNVKESSIARECKYVLYTKAGPEIAVATTKAYMSQVCTLSLLALQTSLNKNLIDNETYIKTLNSFNEITEEVSKLIEKDYTRIAEKIYQKNDLYYIGRNVDYALAMEGSLKLKEISYLHSEAYAAGELKHGTISLIEKGTPVVSVTTNKELKDKTVSNSKEVRSRGAYVIAISPFDISEDSYDHIIKLKDVNDFVNPMIAIVPMQMISYRVALLRGCDIDKPKNLAKSVTVE
jgi:glucosamine--fructose-6-phosphate aminotransferase (isomerizing)